MLKKPAKFYLHTRLHGNVTASLLYRFKPGTVEVLTHIESTALNLFT